MYGLSFCGLDYDYMMDLELTILGILIQAEIDKENFHNDLEMQRLSWQTACLMNASGNYKTAIKPDKLYTPLNKQSDTVSSTQKPSDVKADREELKKTFGLI